MKNEKIKVIIVEPHKPARVALIDNTLEAKQEIVGGWIEAIYPFDDNVALICNEEGKINGEELNRPLFDKDGRIYDIIAGTFIVCGLTDDDFGTLTDEQALHYCAMYMTPYDYIAVNGKIMPYAILEN